MKTRLFISLFVVAMGVIVFSGCQKKKLAKLARSINSYIIQKLIGLDIYTAVICLVW